MDDLKTPEAAERAPDPGGQPGGRPGVRPRSSIRTRLLALASGVMVIAVIILLVAALSAASSVIRAAQETSSQSLRQEVADSLVQINKGLAEQNALLLDQAVRDAHKAADATAAIFSHQIPLAQVSSTLHRGPEGQYSNGADEITSVFIPNIVISRTLKNSALSIELERDVEYSANINIVFKVIKENNPNAGAIYLGTKHGITRYYPNIKLGEVVPADFDVNQRPWYTTAIEKNVGLPNPIAVWTPVYNDATGLGLITTVAIPVYLDDQDPNQRDSDELIGVIGLDVALAEIKNSIESNSFTPGSYSFLIDDQGKAIVLPNQGWLDLLGRSPQADEAIPDLYNQITSADFKLILENMKLGQGGFKSVRLNNQEYFVAYAPFRAGQQDLSNTGWSIATVVPANEVLGKVAALQTELGATTQRVLFSRILPLAMLIAVVLLILAWVGTNRLVEPIIELSQASQKLGAGQWEEPLPQLLQIEKNNSDEIGLLSHTLAEMAGQLRQSFGRLEQRVAERTQELERRSLQLQTAAEISREVTQAHDLDSLLQNAVNLVSQRFGYYNVGIFLVDETSEYAHLKAASGELGQKLLRQEIRLRIGQQGIVGYVTRYGQARLASDVRTDRAYYAEPLLADTRSEAALPLRSGPKIIGALDVQSTRPLAFSEDDLQVLQTLADQLAVAIENVRLVSRLQTTLHEASLLYQQQARQTWEHTTRQSGATAYEYNLLEVKRLTEPSTALQIAPNERLLRIPVRLREQIIGYIGLESDAPDHQWTEDEIAIVEATANQAAQSVENARLLAETQRRAAREKLAAEVTSRMRTSLNMENVLQTAIHELAQRLSIAQVEVHLNPEARPGEESGEASALPSRRNGDEAV